MGLSKSSRILILLAIDSAFFLLELVVGYAVHSLALVADAFHMLNDVLSLCVGLWAVKVANQRGSSSTYTYGWQRAETLGALVNGVFLVALCLSIFLEAIQRFVEPQTVSNPKLVLIVGCFGFASNILGLVLFHDHGHSHGDEEGGHSHDVEDEDEHTHEVMDEGGNVADVLPQQTVAGWPKTQTTNGSASALGDQSTNYTQNDEDATTAGNTTTESTASPLSPSKSYKDSQRHRRRTSGSRTRGFGHANSIHIHPASFRNEIIAAGNLKDIKDVDTTESESEDVLQEEDREVGEDQPLLKNSKSKDDKRHYRTNSRKEPAKDAQHHRHDSWHAKHNHAKPKSSDGKGGHGHSHGDLNMRGVFLHVMGDALGNIGVIATALIIWLAKSPYRYYADPIISLVITFIILCSAIPLCKAASRILLQAVPAHLSVEEIKEDIEQLPGIMSAHHLHVWQLSDTKLVASLHIQVGFDFEGEGSARYMHLVRQVRRCLHEYGIHSSTIQPEFCLDNQHAHTKDGSDDEAANGKPQKSGMQGSKASSLCSASEQRACLLECGNECGGRGQCCDPSQGEPRGTGNGHSH